MKAHPYANLFPMLDDGALRSLADDISENGQREPAIVYNGQILDGRNRYRACELAGVEAKTETFEGSDAEALALVVSLNLRRRHLDESQRAMVAARLSNMTVGRPKTSSIELVSTSISQPVAAAQCNVSVATTKRATVVLREGSPELVAAVESGKIPASVASQLVDRPTEEQQSMVARVNAGAKPSEVLREANRSERLERIVEISKGNAPLSSLGRKFACLYADPPWRYESPGSDSRAIESKYPTMELDAICALDVGSVATDDAILFMWTTPPKITEAVRVLESWGFNYRTCLLWDKQLQGCGFYARQQHELLFIAMRGSVPTPLPATLPRSVVSIKRGEHSAKPHEFYEIIERMYPELPKLELFSRGNDRPGWTAWGNQAHTKGAA